MATPEAIANKRAAALGVITAALAQFPDLPDFPTSGKDPALLHLRQVEWTRDALTAATAALATAHDTIARMVGEVEAATERADKADAALKAAEERIGELTADQPAEGPPAPPETESAKRPNDSAEKTAGQTDSPAAAAATDQAKDQPKAAANAKQKGS
jgi:hypothetical protein